MPGQSGYAVGWGALALINAGLAQEVDAMESVFAWIVGLTIFFALVFALFFVITRETRAILGPRRRLEAEIGLDVLRARLARGEISQAEFEQGKRALGG
jgi:uncharacterized membrane protein